MLDLIRTALGGLLDGTCKVIFSNLRAACRPHRRDRRSRVIHLPEAVRMGAAVPFGGNYTSMKSTHKWEDSRGWVTAREITTFHLGRSPDEIIRTSEVVEAWKGGVKEYTTRREFGLYAIGTEWVIEEPCLRAINETQRCGLFLGHSGPCTAVDSEECEA